MQPWEKQREVEKKKTSTLSADDARQIFDALHRAIGAALESTLAKLTGDMAKENPVFAATVIAPAVAKASKVASDVEFEDLYKRMKERLLQDLRVDPILLHMVMSAPPELRVDIEPRVEEVTGTTLRGRVARLMAAGWFGTPRAISATRKELARTGSDPGGGGSLGDILSVFKSMGFLTEESGGYLLAPGVKVTENVLTVP